MSENVSWSVPIRHRRVVVTGAGSGIGRAVALELAEAGIQVVAMGRRPDALEQTAELATTGTITPVPCDVTDPDRVEAAFAAFEEGGPATALVHAAAQMNMMRAEDMGPGDFAAVVGSTLLGTFNVLRRWAVPLIEAGTSGSAVLLTSSFASKGTPGIAHSSAGKAGVEALVKSLGREWGPYGITLNAVGPGPFPVEKSVDLWYDPAVERRMRSEVALGRYGRLEEIVAPIVFLLSEGATYTTGQALIVDGGMTLSHWPVAPDEIDAGLNNSYPSQPTTR